MSSALDMTITQGDTLAEQYQITNSVTGAAPTSNLVTVELVLKNSLADLDSAAIFTRRSDGTDASNKIVIDDAALWKFTVKATPAQTAALAIGVYELACTTIDAAGNNGEGFRGFATVLQRGSDPAS